ncbi:hypothetical protein C9J03_22885 [Photobacterium gaetbulicola]|uniref:Uncharacterized protein n=1 Tax=Photobacterium gaetbulicola Gung47 TaxID=658445 RepID=A0A0C5WIV2_9GAMM|nr:hypothetical protein [Photobacterium gaetbulicola]AJR06102.1 hypothetical protein H744_1c1077 [Photobacterium gaetbulicola Gung47]PSU02709.1 hypothetical protein C9J03_22885 [Photobacterium gaetbulicola]
MKSATTLFILQFFALISTSVIAKESNAVHRRLLAPEEMMFELNEEATCLAAANYLINDRYNLHLSNYQS